MTDRAVRPATAADVAEVELVSETDHAWVLVDGSKVVGMLVTVPAADHLLIDVDALDPASQGCANAAMTENFEFYPRMGYVESDRRSADGFDRVYFTKTLAVE